MRIQRGAFHPVMPVRKPFNTSMSQIMPRFGTVGLPELRLGKATVLLQALKEIEKALSQKHVTFEEIDNEPFCHRRRVQLGLPTGPLTLTIHKDKLLEDIDWSLQWPSQNLSLSVKESFLAPFIRMGTEISASTGGSYFNITGFWGKRRIMRCLKRLNNLVSENLAHQVAEEQKTTVAKDQNNQAKTTMKDLLQTQINLLTAKQDHYQPLIQDLQRQYAEAQTHTETAIGRERAEALREQLANTQKEDREHRQDTLKAIAELQEKQVRLELTENNEALLRMMDESKALIQASEERMQSVGPEIDVNYETTRILLAPATSEATARVQERVQARLAEPAPTSPSAVEQAIAAASSKSRQTEETSTSANMSEGTIS